MNWIKIDELAFYSEDEVADIYWLAPSDGFWAGAGSWILDIGDGVKDDYLTLNEAKVAYEHYLAVGELPA